MDLKRGYTLGIDISDLKLGPLTTTARKRRIYLLYF
jgi:hypothetical protein